MKGKLNKIFATTALAAALVISSIVPTMAQGEEDTQQVTVDTAGYAQTDVRVGVATDISQVKKVDVTVPLVVALSVVAEDDAEDTYVIIGSSSTSGNGGESTPGEGYLSFINNSVDGSGSPIEVEVQTAEVTVNSANGWTLAPEGASLVEHQMILTLDGQDVTGGTETLTQGKTNTVNLYFNLPAKEENAETGKTTSLKLTAEAGGSKADYDDGESTASAYTVQWYITSNVTTNVEN